MIKSKGLIVLWPDVSEGESAPMQFSHEVQRQCVIIHSGLVSNCNATYKRLSKIVNEQKHTWIIRVKTSMDYTNKKTGAVTTEIITSVIKPKSKVILSMSDFCDQIAEVQKEDMTDSVKTFAGRTIECFCKD